MRLAVLALIAGLALVAGATAAEPLRSGRAEFVKRADSICQPQRNDAKRLIANGVRLLSKKHPRVQAAGREFVRAYRELRRGYNRVAGLPRTVVRAATATGVRSAKALRRKRFERAERLSDEAAALEQRAERPVRNFDFEECRPI